MVSIIDDAIVKRGPDDTTGLKKAGVSPAKTVTTKAPFGGFFMANRILGK